MKNIFCKTVLFFAGLIVWFTLASPARAEAPIVHAILFFSPSCPHCHKVITEGLPPLLEKYPDQLLIVGIDTYTEKGHDLYKAIVNRYQIPPERLGVPTMLVGETVLVGSLEIPEQFPTIIEDGLANGGIDWPDITEVHKLLSEEGVLDSDQPSELEESADVAGDQHVYDDSAKDDADDMVRQDSMDELEKVDGVDYIAENAVVDEQTAVIEVHDEAVLQEDMRLEDKNIGISTSLEEEALASAQMTIAERFARDKSGNMISVVVLFGMVLSVVGVSASVFHSAINPKYWPNWMVPVLVLIGMFVAIYMGYVEVTQTKAVCGPVGDCNTVQQSPYASLFGVIPIGVFGVAGYLLIGVTWLFTIKGPAKWKTFSTLGLWLLSLFGALFSIYLTFLEPFVIGASCAWCLTSAILMHLLLWVTTASAKSVWNEYRPTWM